MVAIRMRFSPLSPKYFLRRLSPATVVGPQWWEVVGTVGKIAPTNCERDLDSSAV